MNRCLTRSEVTHSEAAMRRSRFDSLQTAIPMYTMHGGSRLERKDMMHRTRSGVTVQQ